MTPLLRRFLVAAAVIASIAVIAVGWLAMGFLFSPCQYQLTLTRVSPSERYVAEVYGANCGMGGSRDVVMLRDVSALAVPNVDGTPGGAIAVRDFTPSQEGEDIFWDGETTLVIQYNRSAPPDIERSEWGGVRIEPRRAP
ncbi:MAG: hypothetical protein AB7H66_01760 [Hyphomonadaceae bacterium]